MSVPPPPKMPRNFICTKCGNYSCLGPTEIPFPPCSRCGYSGFASDAGHTDATLQAYGQQCREAALEEAANLAATTCHHEATPFADGFNYAAINIEKMIRSLKS